MLLFLHYCLQLMKSKQEPKCGVSCELWRLDHKISHILHIGSGSEEAKIGFSAILSQDAGMTDTSNLFAAGA